MGKRDAVPFPRREEWIITPGFDQGESLRVLLDTFISKIQED